MQYVFLHFNVNINQSVLHGMSFSFKMNSEDMCNVNHEDRLFRQLLVC